METCKECINYTECNAYLERVGVSFDPERDVCSIFKNRSRFVELPFEPNKGASSFDKVAHITYTFATEAHPLVRHTVEGYYVMYNEGRLYTLEKDGIVILAHGSSPHDTVEKAKHAIEGLSKEREENA